MAAFLITLNSPGKKYCLDDLKIMPCYNGDVVWIVKEVL